MPFQTLACQQFSEEEQRKIVFKDIATGAVAHTIVTESITKEIIAKSKETLKWIKAQF